MSRHFAYLLTAIFAAWVAVGLLVASTLAHAQNGDIEYLRTEAENARAFTRKQRKTTENWQKKAINARKRAEESRHKRDRASWLDDARMYDARGVGGPLQADNVHC